MTSPANNAYQNHIKWIFWGTALSCIPTPSGIAGSISTLLCMMLVFTGCVSLMRFSNFFLRSMWTLTVSILITLLFVVLPFFPTILALSNTKYFIICLEIVSVACSIASDYYICSGMAQVAARRSQFRLRDYCITRRSILLLCNIFISTCAFLVAMFHSVYSSVLLIILALLSILVSLYYCHMLYVVKRLSSYAEAK